MSWHLVVRVSAQITRQRSVKPLGLNLIGGGGHLPLSDHMERHMPWLALTPE
jgi:hypothetical protein